MGRRTKPGAAELKVTFEAVVGQQGGKGIFGIEDAAEEVARRTKLTHMAERIAVYDRGYEGGRRRCPRCGQGQKYKGEMAPELVFDCGTLTVLRAYYACPACGQTSQGKRTPLSGGARVRSVYIRVERLPEPEAGIARASQSAAVRVLRSVTSPSSFSLCLVYS